MFGWFKRRKPLLAIYLDRSSEGRYSGRLIHSTDDGILKGKPFSYFLQPVGRDYATPRYARNMVCHSLSALGIDGRDADCYYETEDNQVRKLT